jgi:uncharacterized protein YjiK
MTTRKLSRPLGLLLILAVLGAGVLAFQHRWVDRTWFNLQQWVGGPSEASLRLSEYRAVVQGEVIEGLTSDVSALTFDPERRSLFTVTNKNSELIELSLEAKVLRRIRLVGFGDPEAVEYIRPGVFVISDEHQQRLIAVHVDDETQVLNADEAEQLPLDDRLGRNKGFEGLAYDSRAGRLFVAKEQSPMMIVEVVGFPYDPQAPGELEITQNPQRDGGLFVRDLSSLQFDERSGHLLALSEQSHLLLELDSDGAVLSTLSLRRGFHGLKASVPQAEGVALDDDGTIYMVSEPNLFYVFKRP